MSHARPPSPTNQERVFLDVGGQRFSTLRCTIYKYPDSLIAKVLSKYPQCGRTFSDPVFIERDPQTFTWILKIYRGYDYERTMPCASADSLQRELDFYQLPSLDELGVSNIPRIVSSWSKMASEKMVRQVAEEITESGLEDMFPWRLYIYYRFSTGDSSRDILVIPDAVEVTKLDPELSFIQERGHDAFVRALNSLDSYQPGKIFGAPPDACNGVRFTLQTPTVEFVEIIGEEARRLGLLADARNVDKWSSDTPRDFSFKDLPFLLLRPHAPGFRYGARTSAYG